MTLIYINKKCNRLKYWFLLAWGVVCWWTGVMSDTTAVIVSVGSADYRWQVRPMFT